MGDWRDKKAGTGSNQQFVIWGRILLTIIYHFQPGINFCYFFTGNMSDVVFFKKICLYKADALSIPFMAQIFMEHTAGMNRIINGNDGNQIFRTEFAKGLGGADTGGTGSNDNKSFHSHTSLTSIAFFGQARTQAGPSSKWAQKSHLITRFRSGEMAGTP